MTQIHNGQNRRYSVLPRHEVFGLQFLTVTRGTFQAEMRQYFVPGTRQAHLQGATIRRSTADGMPVIGRRCRAMPFGIRYERFVPNTLLQPDLIDDIALPVDKKTHAVGARHDFCEVIYQAGHGQVFVNHLPHFKRRDNI